MAIVLIVGVGGEGTAVASMQRLLKRPPEPDEVAAVRSRALVRLAAITDPDRVADAGDPTEAIELPAPALVDDVDLGDPWHEPDPTGSDEDIEMIDANDGPSTEPWRLHGPWRLVAEDEIEDAQPTDEDADARIDADAAEPDIEPAKADVIAFGDPAASLEAAAIVADAAESDAEGETDVEIAERAEPGMQVALFPLPDPVVESGPAAIAVALPETAYCPYCATTLRPAPRVTRRCPQCRQKIVVRQVDDRMVYLAEAALPVFEAERRRLAAVERWAKLRDHWLALALLSGAPRDRIVRATSEVASEAKVAAARALYVATVDHAFDTATREDRWEDAAHLRYDQALVLFDSLGAAAPRMPDDRALPPTVTASR